MTPQKFRKKPVEIEAVQFNGSPERGEAICAWAAENGADAEYHPFLGDRFKGDPTEYVAHAEPYLRIATLEGVMTASKGDWVIRGVKGEFYPCKPDIFEATYERVIEMSSEVMHQVAPPPHDPCEPLLGCATTLQLVNELQARVEVSYIGGEEWPSYRPAR